jgi:hypothetical protein
MKYGQTSRDSQRFLVNTPRGTWNVLLVWSALFLMAGVGSAQTNASQTPSAQLEPIPTQTGPAQPTAVQIQPTQATPIQAAAVKLSPGTTNAPLAQTDKLLQVQPLRSFLEGGTNLPFKGFEANELTSGRYTYSGILVQVIKAKNPLQLINPLAPAQYGSGWDNMELFPTSAKGPRLKFFSIGF